MVDTFCPKCGGKITSENNFCTNCGTKSNNEKPTKTPLRKKMSTSTKIALVMLITMGSIGFIWMFLIGRPQF